MGAAIYHGFILDFARFLENTIEDANRADLLNFSFWDYIHSPLFHFFFMVFTIFLYTKYINNVNDIKFYITKQ